MYKRQVFTLFIARTERRVGRLLSARAHFRAHNIEMQETGPIPHCDRFFVFDPDGNRIEIICWLEPYNPATSGAALLD